MIDTLRVSILFRLSRGCGILEHVLYCFQSWYMHMHKDLEYIHRISPTLRNFKVRSSGKFSCSCPICGDSTKDKTKARGQLYEGKQGNYIFFCHNCGENLPFKALLQQLYPELYKEYSLGAYRRNKAAPTSKDKTQIKKINRKRFLFDTKDRFLEGATCCDKLPKDHPAVVYLRKRQIPDISIFYYVDEYKHWVNELKPGEFKRIKVDEPRILIPLRKEDGTVFGVQGRSLEPKARLRYITTLFDEHPKVFGLDRLDKTKTVYVVEGPIDSLFIKNSIAMAGADIPMSDLGIADYVKIYDNEPRNKEICDRIKKCIENGERVVIWPEEIRQKDINDMYLAGENISMAIMENSCRGLTAKLRFGNWRKC